MALLSYQNNSQLDAATAADQARRDAEKRQATPLITGLAGYVRQCWDAAKQAKMSPGVSGLSIQDRINDAIRRRRGIYDAETEQIIRQNGPSRIFFKLTDEKCHAAKSWLLDAILPAGDKPWSVEPTRDPTLPPQEVQRLTQQAAQAAEAQFGPVLQAMGWQPGQPLPPDIAQGVQALGADMRDQIMDAMRHDARQAAQEIEDAIEDAMDEGGWDEAIAAFIDDLVTYPLAILKGPVWESGRCMTWDDQGQPEVQQKVKIAFKRVDPNNFYPSPRASSSQDGFLIERHVLTRRDLAGMVGVEGYDDDAIRAALEATTDGGLEDWVGLLDESERHRLLDQTRATSDPEGRIDALQFWGWVPGQKLIDYGLDAAQVPDPLEDYHAEVWLVDRWVIKAELNGDNLGRRPYHIASYRPRPGSVWGEGIPEIIADIQDAANACMRALENNLAWCSGPQVVLDVASLPEGENLTEMFPGKIWQVDMSRSNSGRNPISTFQGDSRATELFAIYEKFSQDADNKTGIPRYAYGQGQTGGPLGTASGYSMMIQNMSKAIGAVISAIDLGVLGPIVRLTFETLLLAGSVPYHGDIDVVCKGSKAILEKNNLMARRQEFIGMAMQSPLVQQLLGIEGFADLLRAHVRDLAIDADGAIPSADALRRKEMLAQMQQRMAAMMAAAHGLPPGGPGGTGQGPPPPSGPGQGQPAQAPQAQGMPHPMPPRTPVSIPQGTFNA